MIDVDVIKLFNDSNDTSQFYLSFINSAHTKQKEVFFSLLKDDFLKTLNPEY